MARRHLHQLLRDEQEPFALERFIDERRCQLRRPSPDGSPPSQHRRRHHLQIKRHTSPVFESRAFSPSALVKSPSSSSSSSFVPFREPFDGKRSPLLQLPREKSPSSASRLTAALLLEAAVRIQKEQEQQQQGHKKRRKRKKEESENPSKRFGLCFLASILKRLVVRRRQRGITGEEEEGPLPINSPAKDLLKWEARNGEKAGQRPMQTAGYQQKEADLDMRNPRYGSQTDQEQRKGEEGKFLQSSACCRCGIPESPQNDGGGSPSVSDGGSALAGRVSNSSPSRQLHPVPSPPRGPSPELQTPAASPDRRRTEGQLFSGTGDDGRPGSSYYEEKKEQFSPVSVLDPPFDVEDHQRDDHSHHPDLEAQEEEREVEEDEADVDSFQHSLAIVQKAKQQLLSRIRRFERLAELDPVELEKRLEEEDAEEEDGGCDGPETGGCLHNSVETEVPDVCELVQVVLGLSGGAGRKIPADTRRLVLDLAEEERRVITGPVAVPTEGVEKTAEGVRRRFEAWRGVESNTIDMMVEMDLRQEGDWWRRFSEQVEEAAAEVEAAVLALLVDELTEEFVHGCIN